MSWFRRKPRIKEEKRFILHRHSPLAEKLMEENKIKILNQEQVEEKNKSTFNKNEEK